jgi:hypothetical protein
MLNLFRSHVRSAHGLAVTVALFFFTACAHRVSERPNTTLRSTVGQVLLLENLTGAPLTLLPVEGRGEINDLALAPGEFARLPFILNEQQNAAAAAERELVLIPEGTSPYVSQSVNDLVIRARFGTSASSRELRIVPGFCLLQTNAANTVHAIRVVGPPLSGVPLKRLCPNP